MQAWPACEKVEGQVPAQACHHVEKKRVIFLSIEIHARMSALSDSQAGLIPILESYLHKIEYCQSYNVTVMYMYILVPNSRNRKTQVILRNYSL